MILSGLHNTCIGEDIGAFSFDEFKERGGFITLNPKTFVEMLEKVDQVSKGKLSDGVDVMLTRRAEPILGLLTNAEAATALFNLFYGTTAKLYNKSLTALFHPSIGRSRHVFPWTALQYTSILRQAWMAPNTAEMLDTKVPLFKEERVLQVASVPGDRFVYIATTNGFRCWDNLEKRISYVSWMDLTGEKNVRMSYRCALLQIIGTTLYVVVDTGPGRERPVLLRRKPAPSKNPVTVVVLKLGCCTDSTGRVNVIDRRTYQVQRQSRVEAVASPQGVCVFSICHDELNDECPDKNGEAVPGLYSPTGELFNNAVGDLRLFTGTPLIPVFEKRVRLIFTQEQMYRVILHVCARHVLCIIDDVYGDILGDKWLGFTVKYHDTWGEPAVAIDANMSKWGMAWALALGMPTPIDLQEHYRPYFVTNEGNILFNRVSPMQRYAEHGMLLYHVSNFVTKDPQCVIVSESARPDDATQIRPQRCSAWAVAMFNKTSRNVVRIIDVVQPSTVVEIDTIQYMPNSKVATCASFDGERLVLCSTDGHMLQMSMYYKLSPIKNALAT